MDPFRAAAILERLSIQSAGIDVRLIDASVPDDWNTKKYVPMVVPDPDDVTKPVVLFVDITNLLASGGGGWGIHGSYIMGTL